MAKMKRPRGAFGVVRVTAAAENIRRTLYGGIHVSHPNTTRAYWAKRVVDDHVRTRWKYEELYQLAEDFVSVHGIEKGRGPEVDAQLRARFIKFISDREKAEPWRYKQHKTQPGYMKKGAGVDTIKLAIQEHEYAAKLLANRKAKAAAKKQKAAH